MLQDEEVEVNIDELSQETLWKLYAFISDGATDALPDALNTSAREKGNATDQVTSLSVLPSASVDAAALQKPDEHIQRRQMNVQSAAWSIHRTAEAMRVRQSFPDARHCVGSSLEEAGRAQRGLSRPCLLLLRRMQPSRTMWATTSTHQQARPALAAAVTVVSLDCLCIFCAYSVNWDGFRASLVQGQ